MVHSAVGAAGAGAVRRARDSILRVEERTRRSLAQLEQRIQIKRKALVRAFASLCLPLIAVVIAIVDPVPTLGRLYMRMSEGSTGYTMWERPPIGAYARVFLFNVTNAEEFLRGEHASLRVEEVGPFTYLESRTNTNLTLDWARGVLRYIPRTAVSFVPELSIGDPYDFNLTVPNLPLLSMASLVAEYPYWTTVAFNLLVANLRSAQFRQLTAQEYMWGYDEGLMEAAHTLLPGWVGSPRFGLLLKMYEEQPDEFVEIELERARRYRISNWGGKQTLPQWTDSRESRSVCNHLQGAYEGLYFSPGFTEDTIFHMYRKQTCRTIPMAVRRREKTSLGVEVLVFSPREDAFAASEQNDCVCRDGKCLPAGMSDLSPCYRGISLTISKPHGLHCDPAAFHKVEGLRPEPALHETTVAVDPEMGLALHTISSSQTNLVVKDVRYITLAKPFSDMIYPMFWIKMEFQELTDDLKTVLRWRFVWGPALVVAVQALLAAGGAVVLAWNLLRYLRPRVHMHYHALPLADKPLRVFVHDNPLCDDTDL